MLALGSNKKIKSKSWKRVQKCERRCKPQHSRVLICKKPNDLILPDYSSYFFFFSHPLSSSSLLDPDAEMDVAGFQERERERERER